MKAEVDRLTEVVFDVQRWLPRQGRTSLRPRGYIVVAEISWLVPDGAYGFHDAFGYEFIVARAS